MFGTDSDLIKIGRGFMNHLRASAPAQTNQNNTPFRLKFPNLIQIAPLIPLSFSFARESYNLITNEIHY